MSSALSPGGYVRQGQRSTSPARSVNVQVAVRCRPLNERERTHGDRIAVSCDEDRHEVVFTAPSLQRKNQSSGNSGFNANGKKTFTYDHVFSQTASQEDVYCRVVEPIVDEVLQGYNCTVFAYGQTGTGKTHTMEGRRHDEMLSVADRRLEENAGIIPRAVQHIFKHLRSLTDEHSVRVSHMELYNEQLTDLLGPDEIPTNDSLRVYEDPAKGTFVQGLEDTVVRSEQEIFAVLDKSALKRKTAETLMNKYSSRSHSIFSITIHIKESTPEGADLLKVGKLNLVDLAGSENVGRSGAVKGRAREAGNINQSLLTLGRVITALVDRHPHIPYRDSKLTRLLQESLGGRNKTCVIATVTPGSSSCEETLSTLDYAYRAKSIKNRPTVNQMIAKNVLLKEYTEEISKLKLELDATRAKNGVYISPEEYAHMQKTSTSQSTQISELETEKEELEQKHDSLREKHSRTLDELEREQKILSETQENLRKVTTDLNQTKELLTTTTQQRDENAYLVRMHVASENQLFGEGRQLQETIRSSLSDVNLLHQRVDMKASLENQNVANLTELKGKVACSVSDLCKQLTVHREEQVAAVRSSKANFESAREVIESGMSDVLQNVESLCRKMLSQEEENVEKAIADQKDFDERQEHNLGECNATIHGHSTLFLEGKKEISERCENICTALENSKDVFTQALLCITNHFRTEEDRLSSFESEQRGSLHTLQASVHESASKQQDLLRQLLSSYKQARETQGEAMKQARAKLIQDISSTMDAYISESDERVKSLCAQETKCVDMITHEVNTASLKTTDIVKSSGLLVKEHREGQAVAVQQLKEMVEGLETTQEKHTTEGQSHSDSVAERIESIHASLQDTQSKSQKCFEAIKRDSSSLRRKRSERIALEDESRKTAQADGLAGIESVISGSKQSFKKARVETERVWENTEESTIALETSMRGKLNDELLVDVDKHNIAIDDEHDYTPPVRQWSYVTDLTRTRNHKDLIEDMRKASGLASVRGGDFGQENIPPDGMEHADTQTREASVEERPSTPESAVEVPAEGNGEVVIVEGEEVKEVKVTPTDTAVLVDATNKRIQPSRGSKSKIHPIPVIRKPGGNLAVSKKNSIPSSIPAPRSRHGNRRLGS